MKNLKMMLYSLLMISFILPNLLLSAQGKKVNEKCEKDGDCLSGLKCLLLRNGTRVCGTCTQDRLNTLSERVDKVCKDKDTMSGSVSDQGEVSITEIETKIEICKECVAARKEVLSECFYGNPDPGHVKQLEDWQIALNYNIEIKNKKTSDRKAYYGSKSDYENYLRYIENYCSKNFQQALEDANRRKLEKGGCSDLENWVRSCQDCVNNYNEFKRNAFKGQMSGKREDELQKYGNILRDIKGMLDYKKSNSLCD